MGTSSKHDGNSYDGQTAEMTVADENHVKHHDTEGPERPSWTRSFDSLFACLGGSVGLGNVWRFPYLCYKNGGGAFLVPYFLCMLLGSLPLLILEVGVGQYMGEGCHKAWGILPIFQGLGMSMVVIIFYINCYYNVVLAWAFMYLFNSFTSPLPWDSCDNSWNTDRCSTDFNNKATPTTSFDAFIRNATIISNNATIHNDNKGFNISNEINENMTSRLVDPTTEFLEKNVLDLSNGIDEIGLPKWDLTLCLLLAWVLVYVCVCKGIKTSGKVMYFTAPAPYVFMVIILIRNATLEGSSDGVLYYLKPNLTKLYEYSVWTDAGKQTFFSSCIGQGVMMTIGSYNKFEHNFCRDSIAFALINAFTSMFAGFLVFTILGFMAFQQGLPIDEVAESGPGLVFIAYPKATTQMPLPQFWSAFFFLMIILLALDSEFLGVEAFVTSFLDHYPKTLRRGYRKEIFIAVACLIMFLVGIFFVCRNGMYVFQLVDFYCAGKNLQLIGIFQVIGIAYIYGFRRFYDNMVMMVGSKWMKWLYPYLAVCWNFFTPFLCLSIFILSVVNQEELTYDRPNESEYRYPAWANGIGWLLFVSTVIWIPGVALNRFLKFGFSMKVLRRMLVPFKLKEHQMRPQDRNEKCLNDLEQDICAENYSLVLNKSDGSYTPL